MAPPRNFSTVWMRSRKLPKFRVYVSGTLDWDYEIEAEDKYDALDEAETMFAAEFDPGYMWSAVDATEAEEIENES